jgi:hypothetical protein
MRCPQILRPSDVKLYKPEAWVDQSSRSDILLQAMANVLQGLGNLSNCTTLFRGLGIESSPTPKGMPLRHLDLQDNILATD